MRRSSSLGSTSLANCQRPAYKYAEICAGSGKSRAIHVKAQIQLIRCASDRSDFFHRIHRAELGGLRDADQACAGMVDIPAQSGRPLNFLVMDLAIYRLQRLQDDTVRE